MLALNILPLFLFLLQECLCTPELVTILSDNGNTSSIKECRSPGAGMSSNSSNFQMVLAVLTKQFNFSVSCQRVALNLAAVGEKELIFPQGKVMTLHQTLDNGFEYEVCS